ncbi:MAG: hemerythrin family protein [Deltaproteobacteria bacterium]|nr:hemerythrin family protein [Deltaproteobacteria bacterium]
MTILAWSPQLSVNIAQFDDQHQKLIKLINDLGAAMSSGQGAQVISKTLRGVIDYTATHFAAEEKLMTAHGYPEFRQHKLEHDALVKQVLELRDKLERGNITVSIETMNFLRKWLTDHILKTDKKYGPFLNDKGIS